MISKESLNIVFAGTPLFAKEILECLCNNKFKVKAVYTQPDRPSGRGKKLSASQVKNYAIEKGISVLQPLNFKKEEQINELKALKPDILIVVAYGIILPKKVLNVPKYGCINIHASILPKYRGAAPIQRAIENGEIETGVTLMQMDEGMDTGDILSIAKCEITNSDTSLTLHNKLAKLGANLLNNDLIDIINKTVKPIKQDNKKATYASKITKSEAKINWSEDAEIIDKKIRAFNPWPIAYTQIDDKTIRIHQANILKTDNKYKVGEIIDSNQSIKISTGKGVIEVTKLQLPGGKVLSSKDVLNSNKTLFEKGKLFI